MRLREAEGQVFLPLVTQDATKFNSKSSQWHSIINSKSIEEIKSHPAPYYTFF